jgi:hypothetical protein
VTGSPGTIKKRRQIGSFTLEILDDELLRSGVGIPRSEQTIQTLANTVLSTLGADIVFEEIMTDSVDFHGLA